MSKCRVLFCFFFIILFWAFLKSPPRILDSSQKFGESTVKNAHTFCQQEYVNLQNSTNSMLHNLFVLSREQPEDTKEECLQVWQSFSVSRMFDKVRVETFTHHQTQGVNQCSQNSHAGFRLCSYLKIMSFFLPPSQNYEFQQFRKVTLLVLFFVMLYRMISALLDSSDLLTFAPSSDKVSWS